MPAIIGLGNPGAKYAHTKHNVGFDVLEILSQKLGTPIKRIHCQATTGETLYAGKKLVLARPQTFMNLSGLAVKELMAYYGFSAEETLVIVDDIDLPFGQVRVRGKGGPGTHNGLRHIVQCLGHGDFPRVRVGVGQPPEGWDLADWVLSSYPTPEERKIAYDAYVLAAEAALCWAENGINLCMNRYNKNPT